ncbi:MAG: HPr family phosphocarrier protein [Deltaproteobacteria bacterium]|nr:HPr family phosphocarrier protein [Deltaproteobacteria bacterium]MBI3077289.1 HPr family phosphocarrier protein [Deltaproteobacteria bacterium]
MEVRTFVITNKLGLHARAAAMLVQAASAFEAEIQVEKDGMEVNGKSIMGLLMLAAPQGSSLTVRAKGPDAGAALERLSAIIDGKFGEE